MAENIKWNHILTSISIMEMELMEFQIFVEEFETNCEKNVDQPQQCFASSATEN